MLRWKLKFMADKIIDGMKSEEEKDEEIANFEKFISITEGKMK